MLFYLINGGGDLQVLYFEMSHAFVALGRSGALEDTMEAYIFALIQVKVIIEVPLAEHRTNLSSVVWPY